MMMCLNLYRPARVGKGGIVRLITLSFVLIVSLAHAQVSFELEVDSNRMLIGDQRVLSMLLSGNSEEPSEINFEQWNELGVEILQDQQWLTSEQGYTQQLVFSVFDTGYVKLPPLIVQINGDSIYSNDIALQVQGIIMDSTGLAPIKPIIKEPVRLSDFIYYIIAFLIGLLLIGLVFFMKQYKKPAPEVIEVPLPAHQIAFLALEKLKAKKLWQQGKIKAYQSELTHIIREYLENRFSIKALESTTGEILTDLDKEIQVREWKDQLSEILNMADMIKFAKAMPDLTIHEQFMQKAEAFVRGTRSSEQSTQNDEEE